MRITTFLMLLGLLQVSAKSSAQSVTLSGKNMPLMEVLKEIHHQTDYDFMFMVSAMEGARPVSLDIKDVSLEEALAKVFANQPLGYEIEAGAVTVWMKAHSTPPGTLNGAVTVPPELVLAFLEVQGRVVDSLGQPLPGASVRVLNAEGKRTALQTKTARDGSFELNNVPVDARLEISYIGYVTRTVEASMDVGLVVMTAIESELQEVEVMVSTGYQQLPKERATGSFVFIDKEQLESRNDYRLMDRLVDNVPGLQFDNRGYTDNRSNYSYNIRGLNSFTTTINGPLIIVDGTPYVGDIDLINPIDVESVTLLKDAAAHSIWGARAANGVIVINLKKPQARSPLQLNFGMNFNYSEKDDLWYRKTISTSEFIDIEMDMFNQGYYDADLTSFNGRAKVTSPLVDMLHEHRLGNVSADELAANIARWRGIDYRDEYNHLFANNPARQSYNLGLSGTSKWVNYLLSGSYEKSTAKLKFNYDNRFTVRTVTEIKPTEKLSAEVSMLFIQNEVESGAGTLGYPVRSEGGKLSYYPYAEFQGENGEALTLPHMFNKRFIDTAGNGMLLDWGYRPLEEIGQRQYTRTFQSVNVNIRLKYDFSDHLKAEVRYGLEQQGLHMENLARENSFEMRNLVNRWTQINGDQVIRNLPLGANLKVDDEKTYNQQFRAQLSYNRDWGREHAVSGFLASDVSQVKGNSASYSAFGYDEENKTHVMVDYITPHPTFGNLYNNYRIPNYFGFDGSLQRMVSFLGNAAYTFRDRYIVSGSARRDASNLLGVRTNERWKPLWSVGLAWAVHKERFLQVSWLDLLKIRTTYGHSGNIVAGNGYYPTLYMGENPIYNSLVYAGISTPPDPDRKWEDTRMINVGVDFGLWRNRLSGSVEYFNKRNTDLIAADQVDPTSSLTSMRRNVGVLVGNGWDVVLNSTNIQSASFTWTSSFSLSYVKDVVKSYYGTSSSRYIASGGGKSAYPMEGYSMYSVFSFRSAGLDPENGDPRGYDRNTGEISKDYLALLRDSVQHMVLHGPGIPPYYGFLRNTFSYKNIDLSVNLSYKMGSYFREEMYMDNAYSNWTQYGNYTDRWQQPGDEERTYIPSFPYPSNSNRLEFASSTEDFVHKSDYIRIADVRLGYRTRILAGNKPLLINANVSIRNIGLLWTANKIGVDPDNIYFRSPRTYSFGINVTY